MKKYLTTIIISLVIGFLLSNYMIKEYNGQTIIPTFKETTFDVYLIQQGVYSSKESMETNTKQLTEYIYSVIDDMYYVYIGMTLDIDIASKIKEHYKQKDITTIIKTTTITDLTFKTTLLQYDSILRETNDPTTIQEVINKIMSQYKGGTNEN